MKYKVAFASSDGKVVNQHFGRSKMFHIVEVDEENKTYKYLESRENEPSCNNFEHTDNGLLKSVSLIKDCKVLFVAKIGPGAKEKVEENGIQAIMAPYFIEDILSELINN